MKTLDAWEAIPPISDYYTDDPCVNELFRAININDDIFTEFVEHFWGGTGLGYDSNGAMNGEEVEAALLNMIL